uniref:Nuclear pore complex protein Nup160 n=1 Tax=Anopheles arabiensis TaxID=7173 RepID=A0A182HYW7_ANOAR
MEHCAYGSLVADVWLRNICQNTPKAVKQNSLLALYFSFQTFSEFIVIRPEVSYDSSTGAISSVVLKTQCTILAPNNDLIDFKLSDERLWTLWCNAEGETQALFYELNVEGNENIHNVWSPVILENISDKEHQPLEAGINLKDVYCNRIFQSGIFSDTVIRKSLLMFNRNIASVTTNSSGMYSSMLRLKRYAITCMENQLQLECVSLRQNGPLDEDQIQEISNGLWEKFYLYCMQYRFESSRPIGLFICEKEQKNTSFFNAGIIREKYVSFFRICDGVEFAFFAPIIYDRLWPIENVHKDEHEMMLLQQHPNLFFVQRSNICHFTTSLRSFSTDCPSSDDFLFGEWLSKNELHVHIDEYVRLLCNWCQWNSCSRNFIKAKSCLAIGDTFKALDLFPLSWKGIHNERMLKKILSQDEKLPVITPYASLSAFHLKLIRLFRKYGAHDGVLKLVHSGIDNTLQPVQQTMFQSIEFSCHVDLGHYEEAYNTLIKNCEPARKKDCLRQLVCLLFAVRRLDILLDLPYYGLEEEFTSIVGMSARSADISDCIQYDFLYSFYMNKKNLRRSAIISYEECMRNCFECSSLNHLNRYFNCIMKCLNSLSVTQESYAWIDCPIIDKIEASHIAQDDKIEIVDAKRLEEQLITVHCALLLSTKNEGCKLVTSLDATNLISLMLKQKLYRSAMKLARCRARSMVPTIYEHLTSSCIEASSSANFTASTIDAIEDDAGIPWLNDNGVSDVLSVSHSVTSVWNYLRYTLDQEEDTLVIDAYLAVFNRILSRCAYIPSWLKNWCFENIPIQFIRAYLRHGRLEEAYEYTIELFRTNFFSAGRFNQHTIFPLTMCEYLLYELDNSSIHDKKKHLECYLRIIEVAL